MQKAICSLILKLDPSILRVARTTDQLVEVLCKRGHSEIDSIDSIPGIIQFHVTDLLDGYEYELADHGSFRSLSFHLTDAYLTVDVDVRADIPSLAEDIAELTESGKTLDSVPVISCLP